MLKINHVCFPSYSRPDDPMCQCNKLRSKHDQRYWHNPDPKTQWRVQTHTHTSSTNAYGDIEFRGAAGAGFGKCRRVGFCNILIKYNPDLKTQWRGQTYAYESHLCIQGYLLINKGATMAQDLANVKR